MVENEDLKAHGFYVEGEDDNENDDLNPEEKDDMDEFDDENETEDL